MLSANKHVSTNVDHSTAKSALMSCEKAGQRSASDHLNRPGRSVLNPGSVNASFEPHIEGAQQDRSSLLHQAIQRVMRRNEVEHPKSGVGIISLLRQMHTFDIHLGGMVQRSLSMRNFKPGTGSAMQGNEDASLVKRWPEIYEMLERSGMTRHRELTHRRAHSLRLKLDGPDLLSISPRGAQIASELQTLAEADDCNDLQVDAQAYSLSTEDVEAARHFDTRHRHYTGISERAMATLKFDKTSLPQATVFRRGVVEVFRNRYVTHEEYDPHEKALPRHHEYNPTRRMRKWKIANSIWGPRRESSTACDYYEERSIRELLLSDWKLATIHHQLNMHILRTQLPYEEIFKLSRKTSDNVDAPEVQAVYHALARHAMLIYNAFSYYAMSGKTFKGSRRASETEISYISLNAFYEFLSDGDVIIPPKCTIGRTSNIWAVVDAKDRSTLELDPFNEPNKLCRHEWVQLLVRLAVLRELDVDEKDEPTGDVAGAVEAFCTHLKANLPAIILLNNDDFRSKFCYQEQTDWVLRQHEPFLRSFFAIYASAGQPSRNMKLVSNALLSIGEWIEMLTNVGLIEMGLVTVNVAMKAFSMSQLRSSNDYSTKQEVRFRQLGFEDWLEALVRIAYVIALPTLDEVHETAAKDGGDFLLALYLDDESHFRQFLERRMGTWIDPSPRQRIHRCLGLMLSLMTRLIEGNAPSQGTNNPPTEVRGGVDVSKAKIARFVHYRLGDANLLSFPKATFDGSHITSVLKEIEEFHTAILSGVPAFSGLLPSQIGILRDSMSVAKFNQDDYIFEQGDHGEVFYLITCGYAVATRVDPDDPDKIERTIAQLSESDCFGELALLRNEPRAASIVVTSLTLDVLYITRAEFEEVLGPLATFQLVKYDDKIHSEGVKVEDQPNRVVDPSRVVREVTRAESWYHQKGVEGCQQVGKC